MLTIKSASQPKFVTPDNSIIELQVQFEEFGDAVLPFGASADDVEQHGRDLHARAIAGEFGPISPYVAPEAPDQPIVNGAQTL